MAGNQLKGAIMKIGVVLPIGEQGENRQVPVYQDIRAYARHAEAAGFDSIWIYDHLLYRWPNDPATHGIWEAWTLLTALAEATERVELGTIVLCVPFRNPALLAKMAATLDEVSGGRLILGLGAGWHKPEFEAFGYPFDHLVGRFEEALQIIGPLLREGSVDFHGQYYTAANCAIIPRGPRPNGPPILVASFGPRMLKLTAQHADLWNTAWLGTIDPLAARQAELDAACVEVGRDPKTLGVTVGVNINYEEPGAEPAPPEKELRGAPEQIAAELRRYAERGVAQLICGVSPATPAALDQFAEAVRLYRAE
jgi:probable F420-dependent oxidoreductase